MSVSSGKVLDVDGYSTVDGTRIQQWTDRNTANQQWRIKPAGGRLLRAGEPQQRQGAGHHG
ncbi:RICIN domain-containing protein [Streptomyces sp. RG80]|uniref:RICIN domain-containing protein n=1 Tax=Streptomyces sp. RG80 TaxID=3157340 RepID=UPI00338E7B77